MDNLFVHSRDRGITLCGMLTDDKTYLNVGASVCSNQDNYNRKVGNSIAEGRAEVRPVYQIEVSEEEQTLEDKELRKVLVDKMIGLLQTYQPVDIATDIHRSKTYSRVG